MNPIYKTDNFLIRKANKRDEGILVAKILKNVSKEEVLKK